MNSGNIEIKTPQILRIIVKWIQEISKKALNPEKTILTKGYRFKGKDGLKKKMNDGNTRRLYEHLT